MYYVVGPRQYHAVRSLDSTELYPALNQELINKIPGNLRLSKST
jgi:hypothetical protein